MTDSEIERALDLFAEAARHPLAPRLGTVLRDHVAVFQALRHRGTPWSTIARLCGARDLVDASDEARAGRVLAAQVHRASRAPGRRIAQRRIVAGAQGHFDPAPADEAAVGTLLSELRDM